MEQQFGSSTSRFSVYVSPRSVPIWLRLREWCDAHDSSISRILPQIIEGWLELQASDVARGGDDNRA